MRRTTLFRPQALITVALVATLAGCVVAPARPYYYAPGPVVEVAPPPPRIERYGPPPVAGYVWLGGYWDWREGRHAWVDGHWEAPRAGYRWVPHEWVREGNGWRLAQGHWERR